MVEAVKVYENLQDLPRCCEEIFYAEKDFQLSMEWFRTVVENGSLSTAKPKFAVLFTNSRPLAMMPLQHVHSKLLCSLTNCYTSAYRPLFVQHSFSDEIAQLLGRALGKILTDYPLARIECVPAGWA